MKRGTAARNLYFGLSTIVERTWQDATEKCKIWLEGSDDPASLQPLFVSKTIGRVSVDCIQLIRLITIRAAVLQRLVFVLLLGLHWVLFLFFSPCLLDVRRPSKVRGGTGVFYRRVCRHDLRCLAVFTRNRLCDGSFLGGFKRDMNRDIMDVACVGGGGRRLWIVLISTQVLDAGIVVY